MAVVTFREDRCKGCGLCVSACPRHIIEVQEDRLNEKGFHPVGIRRMDACTGCTACAVICPDLVIEVER